MQRLKQFYSNLVFQYKLQIINKAIINYKIRKIIKEQLNNLIIIINAAIVNVEVAI